MGHVDRDKTTCGSYLRWKYTLMDTTKAQACRTRYHTPSYVRHKTLILQQLDTPNCDWLTEKKMDAKQLSLAVHPTIKTVQQAGGTETLIHTVCIRL